MMLQEICFYARGGQGAVVAARLLVHAAAAEGLHGQAVPLFGGERRGAPVYSFARISDKPVRLRSQISEPDILVVLDRALLRSIPFKVKDDGMLLANAPSRPEVPVKRVYWVDATAIAKGLGLVVAGWPVVNTAMLGALTRVWPLIPLESVKEAIKSTWGGRLGELNAEAAGKAHEEVRGVG